MSVRDKSGVAIKKLRRSQSLLAMMMVTAMELASAEQAAIDFDIPAQPLAAALDSLAKSSNTKLIYADSLVQNLQADALKGKLTVQQALQKLLTKNNLQYEQVGDGVIAVKKVSAAKAKTVKDDSVFELGEVSVTDQQEGGKLTSRDIATSVDVMYADKIADQNVLNAYDLYHRMPGVQITQYGQGITTGKLSFRGFNGEGRVNAVKLLIDGIPSNSNTGNMEFIDSLFPLDIESIEVVRGTNDPRYGLHAIAGSTNITTSEGGSYVKGRVSYGSFNTHEVQSGLGYEKDGFSQNYAISYRASDGYREHSDSEKNSFSGKWAFTPDNKKFKVGLSVRWSDANAEEPGYLTYQEQLLSQTRSLARNATDGGKRQMGQVSTYLDVNLTDELFWSTKAYSSNWKDERFVKFEPAFQQTERQRDETQYGAMTSLTYHPEINWLDDFSLETGFDFQQQENQYQQYRTIDRVRSRLVGGVPTFNPSTYTRNDESWGFLNYGGYVQAVIKPTRWLKITPGYRADAIDSDGLINRATGTAVHFPVNDYGMIHQPKIGAVITPIDGYSLYGNWGRTFQIGLGAATFRNAQAASLRPSINDGWEVGVKLQPVDWVEGRIAYWQQIASNEVSRNLNSNDATYLGSTSRQGVDVEVKVNPVEAVSVWAAYSLQEAKIKEAGVFVVDNYEYRVGNSIVNTPNYLFSAGIDYQITPALKSSLWTSGQGNVFVDQANAAGEYGEYALLNLDLGYQVTKHVDVQFQAKNLTNTQRDYVWYDETYIGANRQPLFSPADGIAFYGAVNMRYDL
ncbi:MAG: TonB-dependent receptor [Methylomonas sp.]|nr:MAG: TonB-dependent receptor [Methylomonas sp.]